MSLLTTASQGPSAGPNSGQGTIPASGATGTWADHTDIRPIMLYLVGLHDDYIPDGRVLTEDLTNVGPHLGSQAVTLLGQSYKQLDASVGAFGTSTLIAAPHAMTSSAPNDTSYNTMVGSLTAMADQRDILATQIKTALASAEFGGQQISTHSASSLTAPSESLQQLAGALAQRGSAGAASG